MTFRQYVDLASRFSAVILRDESGQVVGEYDSRDRGAFAFAAQIGRTARDPECEATICEDVPHGLKSLFMVKPVLRLQGVVMAACHQSIDRLYFEQPATWMSMFPGVQNVPKEIAKGMTKGAKDKWRIAKAEEYATALGYEAPDLLAAWIEAHPDVKPLKKNTGDLDKSRTDYVSAFLMSEFNHSIPLDDLATITGIQIANI